MTCDIGFRRLRSLLPGERKDERRPEKPFVNFVIPMFNEEAAVDHFVQAIERLDVLKACRYELVFVNDGSTDGTLSALRAAKQRNPAIVILSLSRNFGKEAAMTAGLDHARGDAVIPIDADLQDPPELVIEFLDRWRAGADVVYGVRASRKSDRLTKRMTAGWFYTLFNFLSPVRIPHNAGDYRLMDRRVVDEFKKMPERNRFMKALMAWPGFKTDIVEFERGPRKVGRTTWNYWKLWNFALDGITSFSTLPLRLWLYVGAVISLLSFLYAGFIIIRVLFTGNDVPSYPSLMVP